MIDYKETKYGFEYGGARVERICSDDKKGWVRIGINNDEKGRKGKGSIQIHVTKTGKIKIYSDSSEIKLPGVTKDG